MALTSAKSGRSSEKPGLGGGSPKPPTGGRSAYLETPCTRIYWLAEFY